MKLEIRNYENNENLIEPVKVRKNLSETKAIEMAKTLLNEKYNVEIASFMVTGKIDYATGNHNLHHVAFGKNLAGLPTREIKIKLVED